MKKVLLFVCLFLAAFLIISLTKRDGQNLLSSEVDDSSVERETLVQFWDNYHRATELRIQGKFSRAAEEYRMALKIQPDHEESIYYLGNCLYEIGDYPGALQQFERLTVLNPQSQRGFYQLGRVYSTAEPGMVWNLEKAKAAFSRNAELDPEESGPFLEQGRTSLLSSNLEMSLQYFKKAAGFASPAGFFMTGFVEFKLGRLEGASDWFERVLEIAQQENRIAERGGRSEGDTKDHKKMTPLKRAELKSRLFLSWIDSNSKGNGSLIQTPVLVGQQRLKQKSHEINADTGGKGIWGDFNGDRRMDLVVLGQKGLALYQKSSIGFDETKIDLTKFGLTGAWDAVSEDVNLDGVDDLYLLEGGLNSSSKNILLMGRKGPRNGIEFVDETELAGLHGNRSSFRARFVHLTGSKLADLFEMGNDGQLRYYENQNGFFRRKDQELGLEFEGTAADISPVDFDSDGDIDLYLTRWRYPGILYRNDGENRFSDVTASSGLASAGGNNYTSLFFDFDRDERPDLLIPAFGPYEESITYLVDSDWQFVENRPLLFQNKGNGVFEEIGTRMALNRPFGIYDAAASDFDGDGWTDLVFANGGLDPTRLEPSILLKNEGGRRFTEYALIPGFKAVRSWNVSVFDYDQDGFTDFYLAGIGLFSLK